jgi:hypothetical protein
VVDFVKDEIMDAARGLIRQDTYLLKKPLVKRQAIEAGERCS